MVVDASNPALALTHVVDQRFPSLALGALGMPGVTACFCMLDRGRPQPGETVVISGAAGACGSLAGQLARLHGAKAVGICGQDEKATHLVETLGFAAAVNCNAPTFESDLAHACGDGIDVYYDNVGGAVSDACLRLVNDGARMPVCGQIARYDEDVSYATLVSPDALTECVTCACCRLRTAHEVHG